VVFALGLVASTAACGERGEDPGTPPLALEERTFSSGDVRLRAYVGPRVADEPTLVFVHGGPGMSHHSLRPLARVGRRGYQIAFYDQRGVGGSDRVPAAAHTLEAHVEDLEQLRRALGVESMHVAGQSWGGLVAMAYAIEHPERVTALLLLDSVPASWEELERAFQRFHKRRWILVSEGLVSPTVPPPEGADCAPSQRALAPVYFHDPRHPLARSLGGSSCHAGILEATWENIGDYDLRPAIRALPMPVLVVGGRSDPFGPEMALDLVAALPPERTRLHQLDRCGHNGFNECPEAYFAALEAFLDAQRRAKPATSR